MSALVALSRRFASLATPKKHFVRCLATYESSTNRSMDEINHMFGEARLCLQDALESKGTVYFEDDFHDAKRATEDTLKAFDDLCASVTPEQRGSLLAANRPKMAQLKQEFKILEDELIHDD